MIKYSANYSHSNHNFVIQNLVKKNIRDQYYPAICILKNILQRGCPTMMSDFLQSHLGKLHKEPDFKRSYPLISSQIPKWERVIRGDDKNNYIPAHDFFYKSIPELFPEFPFLQQLIIPEMPINEITQIDVEDFKKQQVDFYLPLAFLVIEIDGSQHINSKEDKKRDAHLEKYGVKTVRITTDELRSENDVFQDKVAAIIQRIKITDDLWNEKKNKDNEGYKFFSFSDYKNALKTKSNLNNSFFLSTAIMRMQLLLLELLEDNYLSFDSDWEFAVFAPELNAFEQLACDDLTLWLKNILQLHKIPFKDPKIIVHRVQTFEELKNSISKIKIDFSLTQRYTDEFVNNTDIIFVRTSYLDYYRYYKKGSGIKINYAGLIRYDYFKISTVDPVRYKFKFDADNGYDDEKCFNFFLKNIYGYDGFNAGQLRIIANALSFEDTIGLLPTGGGKSICFQLPVLLQPAISFVVSPIKSLMYDQVQDLEDILFSRVNFISSDLDVEDKALVMNEFGKGKYFFILVSPERFQNKAFRENLMLINSDHKFAYAVIDEVHCLSEWGHDFRTSYLNLSKTIKKYCNNTKFIGLTATASINVLNDIKIEFNIIDENIMTLTDFTRKELEFEVRYSKNKFEDIVKYLHEINDKDNFIVPNENNSKCAIIFCQKTSGDNGCYSLSQNLSNRLNADIKYYSGRVPKKSKIEIMTNEDFNNYKQEVQNDFKQNRFTILAATKAFGMGVNKKNIYYTIHYGIPGSLESLYQEAGRAARDKKLFANKKAKCLVLFTPSTGKSLNDIWDRNSNISKIRNASIGLKGDIETNLYFFTNSIEVIETERKFIRLLFDQYAKPKCENVRIEVSDLMKLSKEIKMLSKTPDNDMELTEKVIYRLSQLGIVSDWTIEYSFKGKFIVDFHDYSENNIKQHLEKTINKYEHNFRIDTLCDNPEYTKYIQIMNLDLDNIDKYIQVLLQWSYDHFSYNRRQSLKNIYESCSKYINKEFDSEEFKTNLEAYFRFDAFYLQDIADDPYANYSLWSKMFFEEKETDKLLSIDSVRKIIQEVNRYLESYMNNLGLDFISGVLRLIANDYENLDGRQRLETSLKKIKSKHPDLLEKTFDVLLTIGSQLKEGQKEQLSTTILKFWGSTFEEIKKINSKLHDQTSLANGLTILSDRMKSNLNLLRGKL